MSVVIPKGAVPFAQSGIGVARRPSVPVRPISYSPAQRQPVFNSAALAARYRLTAGRTGSTGSTGSTGGTPTQSSITQQLTSLGYTAAEVSAILQSGTLAQIQTALINKTLLSPSQIGSEITANQPASSSSSSQGTYYLYIPNPNAPGYELAGQVSTTQTAASGQSWQSVLAGWQNFATGQYITFVPNGGPAPGAGSTVYAIYGPNNSLIGTATNLSGLGNYAGMGGISSIQAIGYIPATTNLNGISTINQLSQTASSKAQAQAFQVFNQTAAQISQTQVQTGISSTVNANPPTATQYSVQYSGNTYYFDTYQQAATTLQYLTAGVGNPVTLYQVTQNGATVYFANKNVANGFAVTNSLASSQSSIAPVSLQTGISVSGGGGTNAQGASYSNAYSVTLPGGQLVYYASQAEAQQALAQIAQGGSPTIYQVQIPGTNNYQYFGDQSLANSVAQYQQDTQIKYVSYLAGLGGPGYVYNSPSGQQFVASSELNLENAINASLNPNSGGISAYNVAGVNYLTQSNAQQAYSNLVLPNQLTITQAKGGGYNLNYNGTSVTSTPFATQSQAQAAQAQYQSYASGNSTTTPSWISFNGQTYTSSNALMSALTGQIVSTGGGNYSLNVGGQSLIFNSLSQAQQAVSAIVSGQTTGFSSVGNVIFTTSAAAQAYANQLNTQSAQTNNAVNHLNNYFNQPAISSATAQANVNAYNTAVNQAYLSSPATTPGTIQNLKLNESLMSWVYGAPAGTSSVFASASNPTGANIAQLKLNNIAQMAISNPQYTPGTIQNLKLNENLITQGLSGIGKTSTPSQTQLQNQYIRLVTQRAALISNPNASASAISSFNSNIKAYNSNVSAFNQQQQTQVTTTTSSGNPFLNDLFNLPNYLSGGRIGQVQSAVSGGVSTGLSDISKGLNSITSGFMGTGVGADIGAIGIGVETAIGYGPIGQEVRSIQNTPVYLNNLTYNISQQKGFESQGETGDIERAEAVLPGYLYYATSFLNPNAAYKSIPNSLPLQIGGLGIQALGLGAGFEAIEGATLVGKAGLGLYAGRGAIGAGVGALYALPSGNPAYIAENALLFGGLSAVAAPAANLIGRGVKGGIATLDEGLGYPMTDIRSLGVLASRAENSLSGGVFGSFGIQDSLKTQFGSGIFGSFGFQDDLSKAVSSILNSAKGSTAYGIAQSTADFFGSAGDSLSDSFGGLSRTIGSAPVKANIALYNTKNSITDFFDLMSSPKNNLFGAGQDVVDTSLSDQAYSSLVRPVKNAFGSAANGIQNATNPVVDQFLYAGYRTSGALNSIGDNFADVFNTGRYVVGQAPGNLMDSLNSFLNIKPVSVSGGGVTTDLTRTITDAFRTENGLFGSFGIQNDISNFIHPAPQESLTSLINPNLGNDVLSGGLNNSIFPDNIDNTYTSQLSNSLPKLVNPPSGNFASLADRMSFVGYATKGYVGPTTNNIADFLNSASNMVRGSTIVDFGNSLLDYGSGMGSSLFEAGEGLGSSISDIGQGVVSGYRSLTDSLYSVTASGRADAAAESGLYDAEGNYVYTTPKQPLTTTQRNLLSINVTRPTGDTGLEGNIIPGGPGSNTNFTGNLKMNGSYRLTGISNNDYLTRPNVTTLGGSLSGNENVFAINPDSIGRVVANSSNVSPIGGNLFSLENLSLPITGEPEEILPEIKIRPSANASTIKTTTLPSLDETLSYPSSYTDKFANNSAGVSRSTVTGNSSNIMEHSNSLFDSVVNVPSNTTGNSIFDVSNTKVGGNLFTLKSTTQFGQAETTGGMAPLIQRNVAESILAKANASNVSLLGGGLSSSQGQELDEATGILNGMGISIPNQANFGISGTLGSLSNAIQKVQKKTTNTSVTPTQTKKATQTQSLPSTSFFQSFLTFPPPTTQQTSTRQSSVSQSIFQSFLQPQQSTQPSTLQQQNSNTQTAAIGLGLLVSQFLQPVQNTSVQQSSQSQYLQYMQPPSGQLFQSPTLNIQSSYYNSQVQPQVQSSLTSLQSPLTSLQSYYSSQSQIQPLVQEQDQQNGLLSGLFSEQALAYQYGYPSPLNNIFLPPYGGGFPVKNKKKGKFGYLYTPRQHRVSENIGADIEASLGNIFSGYGIRQNYGTRQTSGASKKTQTQKFAKRPSPLFTLPKLGFTQSSRFTPTKTQKKVNAKSANNSLYGLNLMGMVKGNYGTSKPNPTTIQTKKKQTPIKTKKGKSSPNAARLGVNTSIINSFLGQ